MDPTFDAESEPVSNLQLTAQENGSAFMEPIEACAGDCDRFLKRDGYIPVRGTNVCHSEQDYLLDWRTDVDGVLIEWDSICGLNLNLSYLQVVPPGNVRLHRVYHVLKKHLDLTKYNRVALRVLQDCLASQLSYTEGWETWLGFIPECALTTEYTPNVIRAFTLKTLKNLKSVFQRKLKQSRGSNIAPHTLVKNNLNDISKLRIMPDEQESLMRVFQSALDETDGMLDGFRKIMITFRFGEKMHTVATLPIRDKTAVRCVSVHAGLEIGASYIGEDEDETLVNIDLMWSRQGLQEVIGSRGRLFPTFSFTECANFQSNLDGKLMDIHRDLRNVCQFPDSLNFLQMYCDLPHRCPDTRWHPVSTAIIVPLGVVKLRRNIERDAMTYISEAENNFSNMTNCRCRLEIVVLLPEVPDIVNASDILVTEKSPTYWRNTPFWHHSRTLDLLLLFVM